MSETTDPTKKKNLATSYDDKFSNPSTHVDKSWDSINKHIKDNPKSSSFEAFNASENSDYIEGWENPHTYAGGFDTNVYDPFEEIRANNQSDLNKISKIPTRISVKIAAEVAKIPGYITGLAGGIGGEISDKFTGKDEYSFTEQAFNNGWVKAVEQLNQNINEELLPVYVKKSIKEGSFWDNATSWDFWATEGADGIGFMVSMMVPGAILKGLGLGSKMMNATNKLIALGNNSSKLAKAARAVESLGMTAEKFNVFNATMANTYLEAAAEAGGAMENYEKVGKQQLIDKLQKEGYSYDEAVAQSNQQKAILGKDMFKANALLLLVPNALQSSMMFGKGASKFMSSYTTKEALKAAGKRIGKNFLSEGFIEEAGQSTVENYLSEKANKNQLKSKGVFNLDDFDSKGLKQAYLDTLTSVDGQKAIFLGGVLGSTMSVYQGREEDIQNKKNSDDVTGLTEKYDSSLRSIIETDDYKKDVNGDIVYDYNNKPIIDKESVIRKFRTIDELSDRFDEYDEALESGDTELLEKSRNKTIQDVMLPFVQKGELGIEAVDKYYDKMLESEEVQNSEEYESIKNRKSEILEIAKDVSKKYENYQNFAMSSFDIKIPVQDKTQLNLLNAVKKDYFNRLSSSYAMTEIERNQVKNKLKEVSLKIKSIEDVHKVDNPTLSTFMDDSDKKSPDENKNILAEKNSTYKKLKDYQTRLTNKLESVEKEISEGFFNNEKIQSDFTNTYSNLIKDGVFNQQTVNEEEQSESAIDSDLAEHFRNELLDKINENNQENSKVFTKEDFNDYIDGLNDDLAQGFRLDPILSKMYDNLPDRRSQIDVNNEEFELDNQIKTELGEQPNETLTTQISDVENHEQTTEVNLKAEVTNSESQNNSYKNDHISNHRTISKVEKTDESKGVKSGDKISYVNQEWIDYENIPVDKTGTELHFSLNEKGGYNNETKLAVKLMQDILNGVPISTIVAKSKTKSLDNLRQFLSDYTPLYLGFKDSQTKTLLDVKLVNQNTQGEIDKNQIFLKQKEVRLQIINHILNGGKLEDISTNITAQMPGVLQIDLNEDGTVPENKITDLNYFQLNGLIDDQGNLTNKGFHEIRERLSVVVDFSNLQNAKGELIPLPTKTESFRPKGEFYMKIPMANGQDFYLKLNSVKIPQTKAEVIYEICKYRFAPEGVINKGLTLKEVAKTNPDLIELIKTELKQEYDVISKIKNQDDITLKDVIDIIIYDNNASDKVKFNFRGTGIEGQSVLEYGSNTIDNLEELENKKDELIEWITSTKRQNIRMGSLKNIGGINTNSKDYLDYLINNNILNTNAVTFDKEGNSLPTFGGYTNIYWKNLNIKNKVEIKDTVSTKPVSTSNSDILNEGDIIIGIDSNGKESDRIVVKAYNGVIKQDGKEFTKLSEMIKYLNESPGNFDNAKYSLKEKEENIRKSENNSVSLQNNIEFTHQIDGTEENKKVKEMESKI